MTLQIAVFFKAMVMKSAWIMAPLFGAVSFFASLQLLVLQQSTVEAPAVLDLWRVALTLGIGIFVTLVGVIYKDQNEKISEIKVAIKVAMEKSEARQNRMMGLMVTFVSMQAGSTPAGVEMIKKIMMSDVNDV